MKTAQEINDSFRKQIRNRQKQHLFSSIRTKYTQQSNSQSVPKQPQMLAQTSNSTVTPITPIPQIPQLLQQLHQTDGIRICNKILDQGMHQSLLQNLKQMSQVPQTLQLISTIISKQKVKIAHKFIKLGLIQQVLRLCQSRCYVDVCMNILANVVFENVEYGEFMLENFVHRRVIAVFRAMGLGGVGVSKGDEDTGFLVMWALAAMLEAENTTSYKQQFMQILNFALQVLKSQRYISLIIQIIFLVGYSFRQQTQSTTNTAINQILNQTTTKSKYIQNLLITIKLLSPFNIDYSKIATLATMAQGKLISYCVRILEKIAGEYPQYIPRNFEWWQCIYLKLHKPQDTQYYTILLKKSKQKSEFVYRILSDILDTYPPTHLTLTNEVLVCLNSLLQLCGDSVEEKNKLKFYVKSTNIFGKLGKLYESRNWELERKCQYLLTAFSM